MIKNTCGIISAYMNVFCRLCGASERIDSILNCVGGVKDFVGYSIDKMEKSVQEDINIEQLLKIINDTYNKNDDELESNIL